jgi:hypothetical protein
VFLPRIWLQNFALKFLRFFPELPSWGGKYLQIPTEGGHLFRLDGGHRSDLKAATIPS